MRFKQSTFVCKKNWKIWKPEEQSNHQYRIAEIAQNSKKRWGELRIFAAAQNPLKVYQLALWWKTHMEYNNDNNINNYNNALRY